MFDINDLNNKVNENCDNKEHYELMINDYQSRVKYLDVIVSKNENHEKAWIIRVTVNACKDLIKSFFRSKTISLDELMDEPVRMEEGQKEILEIVLNLPEKYKDIVYLHYYEGYSAVEIGKLLGKNVNTVYTLLSRARKILQERLEVAGYGQ